MEAGICHLPNWIGHWEPWVYAGYGSWAYHDHEYPQPSGHARHCRMYRVFMEGTEGLDFETREAEEKPYPILVDADEFIMRHWPSEEFREYLECDMKTMRWMGVKLLRVHVMSHTIASHEGFLDWYLDLAQECGIKVYFDVMDLDSLNDYIAQYGDRVHRWQLMNEMPTANPFEDHPRLTAYFGDVYRKAKEAFPEARIGINSAGWGIGGGFPLAEILADLRANGLDLDFIGIDYYVSDRADPVRFIDDVEKVKVQICLSRKKPICRNEYRYWLDSCLYVRGSGNH